MTLWGTGRPLREFINTDDIADAGIFLLQNYSGDEPVNVGTGEEVSMLELAEMVKRATGYNGRIVLDESRPDGMMRRLCDSSRIRGMGWKPGINLETGLKELYAWYLRTF